MQVVLPWREIPDHAGKLDRLQEKCHQGWSVAVPTCANQQVFISLISPLGLHAHTFSGFPHAIMLVLIDSELLFKVVHQPVRSPSWTAVV